MKFLALIRLDLTGMSCVDRRKDWHNGTLICFTLSTSGALSIGDKSGARLKTAFFHHSAAKDKDV